MNYYFDITDVTVEKY